MNTITQLAQNQHNRFTKRSRMEKYQPKLNWQQTWPDAPHIFHAFVDGISAGCVKKTYLPGMVKVWQWTGCHAPYFGRLSPKMNVSGYEDTARLAVQRAEEYFEAVMRMPIREGWEPPPSRD